MAKRVLTIKSTLIPTSMQGAPSRRAAGGHTLSYEVVIHVREKMWDNQKYIVYNFYTSADKFLHNNRYSISSMLDGHRKHSVFVPYVDQTIKIRSEFKNLAELDDFYKGLLKDADTK